MTDHALNLQAGPHRIGKPLADRQSQPRAAILPGGLGVFLFEHPKDALLCAFRNALAAVLDDEGQLRAVTCDPDRQLDPPFFGELHGIGNEVEQDLTQFAHVATYGCRQIGRQVQMQTQTFFLCAGGHQDCDVAQQRAGREGLFSQFRSSGFHFGVVQNVVQNGHEAFARRMCRLQLPLLARCQAVAGKAAQQAQHSVHRRSDFMAHHRQKLGLGAVGCLCPFARIGMSADLTAQLLGLLGHQQLQFQPVTLQLRKVLVAFGGKGMVFDALQTENLSCGFHVCNLVDTLRHDASHRFAMGQPRQRGGKRVQPPGDVAADIKPDHDQRDQKCRYRAPSIKLLGCTYGGRGPVARLNRARGDQIGKGLRFTVQPPHRLSDLALRQRDKLIQIENASCQVEDIFSFRRRC